MSYSAPQHNSSNSVIECLLKSSRLKQSLWSTAGYCFTVAQEVVWQLGRPPYHSEIWYGGTIPIWRDLGSWFSGNR